MERKAPGEPEQQEVEDGGNGVRWEQERKVFI